jgi:hypothetical protein
MTYVLTLAAGFAGFVLVAEILPLALVYRLSRERKAEPDA